MKKMVAKDGTVFGVFNQGNGDYIASEDDSGFHYAPPQHRTLPHWSQAERKRQLLDAVKEYELQLENDE